MTLSLYNEQFSCNIPNLIEHFIPFLPIPLLHFRINLWEGVNSYRGKKYEKIQMAYDVSVSLISMELSIFESILIIILSVTKYTINEGRNQKNKT